MSEFVLSFVYAAAFLASERAVKRVTDWHDGTVCLFVFSAGVVASVALRVLR